MIMGSGLGCCSAVWQMRKMGELPEEVFRFECLSYVDRHSSEIDLRQGQFVRLES